MLFRSTDGYMAPEQTTPHVNARADVYALGAILAGLTAENAAGGWHLSGKGASHLSSSLRPLRSIVARAMAVAPETRYPDAAALAADVRRFADGEAVLAHRERPLERAGRFVRTYRTPIALVLTYLVARLLLLFWPAG